MEELLELHRCINEQRYHDALVIIEAMEEMSREDKISKIGSFIKILLIHLIKRHAEKRTTRSWDASIFNAVFEIQRINQRRKTGGYYMTRDELSETIEAYYSAALRFAALEAFGGRYDATELETMFDPAEVKHETLEMIRQQTQYFC